jgi:hypothetical protein
MRNRIGGACYDFRMISLFGRGRPDHPMADSASVRRILGELPRDPIKALEELGHWHESVAATPDFRPEMRVEVLLAIDAAAELHVRKVLREYLLPGRLTRFQENRLWSAAQGYWMPASLALAQLVDLFLQGAKGVERARPQLPALLAGALRALAQRIKWAYFRYGPNDPAAWGAFNRVYGFAEAAGVSKAEGVVGSTPRQEFLRGLMLAASAPECLLPAQLDGVEKLIGRWSGSLQVSGTHDPETPFWTDVQRSMVPLRASRMLQPGPGVRFFGAGGALRELAALRQAMKSSSAPQADLGIGVPVEREEALGLLAHLEKCWSPHAPERRHARHAVKSRLGVANGLEGVIESLDESVSLSFDGSAAENWVVENVSAGGFGALVAHTKGDWLRVGALVAMQPEGGKNWLVGVVRRVHRASAQQARVGIETLSRAPEVAQLRVGGASETGVILRPLTPSAGQVRIALRPGVFAPGQNLERPGGTPQRVYLPQGLEDRGEDYEIASFREMVRDG